MSTKKERRETKQRLLQSKADKKRNQELMRGVKVDRVAVDEVDGVVRSYKIDMMGDLLNDADQYVWHTGVVQGHAHGYVGKKTTQVANPYGRPPGPVNGSSMTPAEAMLEVSRSMYELSSKLSDQSNQIHTANRYTAEIVANSYNQTEKMQEILSFYVTELALARKQAEVWERRYVELSESLRDG